MSNGPLQIALREMQKRVVSPLALGGMAVAIMVLTVAGPFGTFADFDLPKRFAYWAVVVASTYVLGEGLITFVSELLRPALPAYWPRLLLAALLGSVPIALVVILTGMGFYQKVSAEMVLSQFFYVAVVTLTIAVVLGIIGQTARQAQAAPAVAVMEDAPPRRPAILDRVPAPQRGELLALIVEDHYVDIVTSRGKTLVLMRLADAIREAEPVEGLQIHRSHWVARSAVTRAVRVEGKLLLELSNGLRLPVSRSALAEVKAAGLA